jgi:hypothetical protein
MLNHTARDFKPVRFTIRMVVGVAFLDPAAPFADKKFSQIALVTMIAGDKGVERLDPVNEA